MFSPTVSESKSAPDWKTMVTLRRTSSKSGSLNSVTSSPSIIIWPESAFPFFLTREADAMAQIAGLLPKGSVLIWDGSLWHGGGANTTVERRTGIAMNYCAGFIRQQENQQLGLAPALVRTFPKRLQELVGYGVYQGLIGHIDKKSPAQLLNGSGAFESIWNRT